MYNECILGDLFFVEVLGGFSRIFMFYFCVVVYNVVNGRL